MPPRVITILTFYNLFCDSNLSSYFKVVQQSFYSALSIFPFPYPSEFSKYFPFSYFHYCIHTPSAGHLTITREIQTLSPHSPPKPPYLYSSLPPFLLYTPSILCKGVWNPVHASPGLSLTISLSYMHLTLQHSDKTPKVPFMHNVILHL